MKTIGLIGGMSWESTAVYYRLLNERCRDLRGGLHSAPLLLHSFDFADIEALQKQDDWSGAALKLAGAGKALAAAGAELIVICTNTMHRVADAVEDASGLPLVHIADATARAVRRKALRRPLLLGTRYTMEQDFYRGRMRDRFGIDVLIPQKDERDAIHGIIYSELCHGRVRDTSRKRCLEIIERAGGDGADGVILGCTEIGLLIDASDTTLAVLDSTRIHVEAALEVAANEG